MKKTIITIKVFTVLVLAIITTPSSAQNQKDSANKADMQKQQIELSKTNKNHQLLAGLNGKWAFKGRHIPTDTTRKPIEIFGTITRKGIWENRYFITETSSGKKTPMPWADWKEMTYHDMYIEGYDNAKNKFFFTVVGNHWSTGYMSCQGSYDSTTMSLTYEGEFEPAPETIVKVLRIIKFVDSNHYEEEWHQSIGGKEIQRSEASYRRINSNK